MTIRIPAFIPALYQSGKRMARRPLLDAETDEPHDLVTISAAALGVLAVGLIAVLMGMS